MSPEHFHRLMVHPQTPALLDAMLADNARVDRELAAQSQRKECCTDAYVVTCQDGWDEWICPWCGFQWATPCR